MPAPILPTSSWKVGFPVNPGRYFVAKDNKNFDNCQYCTIQTGTVKLFNADLTYNFVEITFVENGNKKFTYKKFSNGAVDVSDAKLLDVPVDELYFFGPVFVPGNL